MDSFESPQEWLVENLNNRCVASVIHGDLFDSFEHIFIFYEWDLDENLICVKGRHIFGFLHRWLA